MRFSRRRAGVSSIVGSIFFVLIMIVAIASLVTIFNSFTAYNQQVNNASNAAAQVADTELSVSSGQFGAFPPSTTSSFNVATTSCTAGTAGSTAYTSVQKVVYAANMWWDFFYCNSAYEYSTSFDGVHWQTQTNIPSLVSGYAVGPYFDLWVSGTTIYIAIAEHGADGFQLGIGTLAQGGTDSAPAGTISWSSAPATVATPSAEGAATGPIQVVVDGTGDVWVAVVQGTCSSTTNCNIGVYERQVCTSGTAANDGWEPNACTSATGPTDYAPSVLTGISENAQAILNPAISSYNSIGAILLYETGEAGTNDIGPIGVVTTTSLMSATWTTSITLTGDYSLGSSSAIVIGTTLYVAGLEGTAGATSTTGGLDYWTLPFTSMAAATQSTQTPIETTTEAWQAALASSGTTLVLFDNPPASVDTCPAGDTCIQYYTSSTLGSIWSNAILLDSSETAVSGLSPASGAFAITWTNSAPDVRFAALSSFTLSNDSPFSVHIVDAYVYNPSTNTLVAHWYYNTTEDFDYWVGQGNTMVIPLRFVWAADTSYLITFSTDQGVTAQTTLTTLPGGTVSCPSGEFFNEISPNDDCASATSSTNPYLVSGSASDTCSDTSTSAYYTGLIMEYTTSASTSGNDYFSYSFQVTSPNADTTSTWQLYYGSGTPPTCELASSFTGSATALGEPYTVASQSAASANDIREVQQSVSVALSNLSPSTTYWFDLQVTNAADTWVYSNPHLAITDVLSTNSPTLATSENTSTCIDETTTTPEMMGLANGASGIKFTTGGTGFSGTVFGELTFNLANAATSAPDTTYTVRYGTGTAPICNNGEASGTAVPGNSYSYYSQAAETGGSAQRVGFVLTGLTASTTYWVDVESVDSSGLHWTYSDPVLTTMNMPTAGTNSLPAASESSSTTATCTDDTSTIPFNAGFGVFYAIPSSAEGNLLVSLTFQVGVPAAAGAAEATTWQADYGTGVPPTCGEYYQGSQAGNPVTLNSQAAVAGGYSQSETFVIQGIERPTGTTIWIDIQTIDGTTAESWVFSHPQIAVAYFPE